MTRAGPRHVFMTTDAVGGVWHYATGLAEELARSGDAVTLAVMGPPPDAAQRCCIGEGVQLVESGLPLDWMCADGTEAAAAARALVRLVRESGANLMHCNSPALVGAAPFPVPVVAVAHGCIATWWQAAKAGPVDPACRWHGDLMRRGLTVADAAVAPSASFAATLRATYGLPQLPRVVHNGRPPAASPGSDNPPLDAALTVGRMWDPVKNAPVIDRIAALTDLRMLAAGALAGPHGEVAEFRHAVALGPVPQEKLGELLALRPIFVSAATFEPFGLAVLEAAAAGCALVLSDIPTFRELWEGAAIFAAPDDAQGFAAALGALRADPERRRALGAAACARAAHLTPQASAAAMQGIYAELLGQREVAA